MNNKSLSEIGQRNYSYSCCGCCWWWWWWWWWWGCFAGCDGECL